ncbi:hypothetical protein ILYODFUR_036832 [Ilyodon furcidens]|uniref:Uncharacterized protein n=1 Tax=Ilyodon furcidens TaxID=33524 RepID=A0ABV0UNI8_9TELE
MAMSFELDLEFKDEYNDKDSIQYKHLSSDINKVVSTFHFSSRLQMCFNVDRINQIFFTQLKKQYSSLNGFTGVSVTGFRKGSVVTDFTVKISGSVNQTQMNEANSKLNEALKPIATVIGTVVAKYYSPTQLKSSVSEVLYTGQTMTLTSDPAGFNMGNVKKAVWRFNGLETRSERHKSSASGNQYNLTVENVILGDAGKLKQT